MADLVKPNHPIHPTFDERISVQVEGQLPQFVKQDHETFVAFMEAYYEYMEQEGKPYEIIGNLNKYANVDETVNEFLNYFKKQFAEDVPETVFANANKPFVLKHLRDFYRSKGTEKSFAFLFRLLFKEEITFYFPGKDILKTSDGKYNTSKIVRTVDTSGTDKIFNIVGHKIIGLTSNAEAVVELVLNENIGNFVVSTVFLSGVVGEFQLGETFRVTTPNENWDFKAGGMLTDVSMITPGNGYSVGDFIPVVGGGASAGGASVTVSELTSGSIDKTNIVSGGTGYTIGDKLTIDNAGHLNVDGRTVSILVKAVDNNGTITKLEIESSGRGYTSLPTVTGGGTGNGANITLSGFGIGGVETISIVNQGFGFESNPTLDFTSKGDGTAVGLGLASGYEDQYQPGFFSNDGFLSANKYIQDSFYYQLFSYVISSTKNISEWRDVIKRLNHPAGLALFGNVQLISLITPLGGVIAGIPQRRHYTIVFHDGDIIPPVVLDVAVDTCLGQQNIKVFNKDDLGFIVDSDIEESIDYGLITDNFIDFKTDYDLITNTNVFHYAPTKCQTYEQDLGIQKLINVEGRFNDDQTGHEDQGSILDGASSPDDYGLITEAQTDYNDYGRRGKDYRSKYTEPHELRTGDIAGLKTGKHITQLRLGPLRRGVDRRKFRKVLSEKDFPAWNPKKYVPYGLGSLEHSELEQNQGIYPIHIEDMANEKIVDFALFGGLKDRRINGTVITQFDTDTGSAFDLNQSIGSVQNQFIRFFADRSINT